MNEFVDMHVHSKFSIDGMSTMEDYCLIAGKTGTRVICFTEHVDFNSAEKNLSIVMKKKDIESGDLVLFVGCPCQVAAIYSFLGASLR